MSTPNPKRPLRVLIVDDQPDVVTAIRLLLRALRFDTESAGSLKEALDRLNRPGIDCVILDLQLPDANGMRAAEVLQSTFPNIPFLIYTGYPDLAIRAIHSGAQDAVVKPGDPEAWESRILYAIARHQVRYQFRPLAESLEKSLRLTDKLIDSVEPGSAHFGRIEP